MVTFVTFIYALWAGIAYRYLKIHGESEVLLDLLTASEGQFADISFLLSCYEQKGSNSLRKLKSSTKSFPGSMHLLSKLILKP